MMLKGTLASRCPLLPLFNDNCIGLSVLSKIFAWHFNSCNLSSQWQRPAVPEGEQISC